MGMGGREFSPSPVPDGIAHPLDKLWHRGLSEGEQVASAIA